jgi:Protein of unknown function (DUF2892)
MKRRTVNITPIERLLRVAIGIGLVLAAIAVISTGVNALTVIGALLLAAAGLDLGVTGALGYCPLYARLGYVPSSLRRSV